MRLALKTREFSPKVDAELTHVAYIVLSCHNALAHAGRQAIRDITIILLIELFKLFKLLYKLYNLFFTCDLVFIMIENEISCLFLKNI